MRTQLIKTAIEKFGRHGLEGTGTRDIAAAAGTTMSSITYHFGGKEGLYLASADHIFGHLHSVVNTPPIPALDAEASPDRRIDMICEVLARVGEFMLDDQSADFALFVARVQQSPPPEVRKLMQEHMPNLLNMISDQLAELWPGLDRIEVRATALFLFGLAVTMRHARTTLCLMMEVETINEALRPRLLARLDRTARAIMADGA